jgi:hypothetical protein
LRVHCAKRGGNQSNIPEADQDNQDVPFADSQEDTIGTDNNARYRIYNHGGRFWHVPENLVLSNKLNLRSAFGLWWYGMPGHQVENREGAVRAAPVRPFRLFKKDMLPKQVKAAFENQWEPIMNIMAAANDNLDVDPNNFDEAYTSAFKYLKEQRLSYVFQKQRARPAEWAISTWAKHAKASMIRKYGTETDKSHLAPMSRFNKPRQFKSPRRRKPMAANARRTA